MKYLYKDYQRVLNNLCKYGVNEKKHLLWKEGGVPCIDAKVWNDHQDWIKEIHIRTTKGRRFKIDKATFNAEKKEINFGHGTQYVVGKEHWDITDAKDNTPEQLTI